jgi:hypothetical protein
MGGFNIKLNKNELNALPVADAVKGGFVNSDNAEFVKKSEVLNAIFGGSKNETGVVGKPKR